MKKFALIISAAILAIGAMSPVLAMTGPLVNGEPPYTEVDFSSLDAISTPHDETVNNPQEWYKGWWYVNITNNTATQWAGVVIQAGAGDLVAIVEGDGLVDEWGFSGDSVVSNKTGTFVYEGVLGDGVRTYDNGATGNLWQKATFTFATPLAQTQKVAFKIYTDNSYYQEPYASSFSVTLTPVAVPEPGSLVALFGGVAALAGFARRRR